jgi:hypothetical protein
MRSSSQTKAIPLREALRIFWDWRQASISVEVCFFCREGTYESVRVSIDGVVRLVDSEGIITIAGDGREMELDLRGSEITRARQRDGGPKNLDPLDPDSILQVKFPDGEICLVFPYRRVGLGNGRRRWETGSEWIQNMIAKAAEQHSGSAKIAGKLFRASALAARHDTASKPRTSKDGPPLLSVAAMLVILVLTALVLTPSGPPRLLFELGVRPKMKDPNTLVWVITRDGNYYCQGSVLDGRKPGSFMSQANALTKGYQPALGGYCQDPDTTGSGTQPAGLFSYYRTLRQGGKAFLSRLTRIPYSWLAQT